eukprot:5918297-Ditylum_brightwellii.AAC.1
MAFLYNNFHSGVASSVFLATASPSFFLFFPANEVSDSSSNALLLVADVFCSSSVSSDFTFFALLAGFRVSTSVLSHDVNMERHMTNRQNTTRQQHYDYAMDDTLVSRL